MEAPIIIFTNTFPYGSGETFLETEFPYLLALKRPVVLVPLYQEGERRFVPSTPEAPVTVTPPLLSFPPKNRRKLLFYGLCNGAPAFFAVRDFFAQKVWRSRFRAWRLGASWLLIRTILSKKRRMLHTLLSTAHPEYATLYFYWGDKSVLLLPFLRHKGKTIVRFHGSDLYEEAHGFHPFRIRVLPYINLACPVSQHGADYLCQRYGATAPPTLVARLGSLDHGLGPIPPPDGSSFHIVSCARLVPIKRLNLICKALRLLYRTQRLPVPVRWTLIGDGPIRYELERSVQIAALLDAVSVDFLGHKPHDSVMQFYRETPVDLFALTSKSEGVPVSIMEALSFGIPVMATAVGGVPELVSNHVGHLLPADPTTEEVAEALLSFIHLPQDQRNQKRQAARTSWEIGWNADEHFKAFTSTLKNL